MKKASFATLLVAITTLFISCSKDAGNTPCTINSAAIAGTYKLTAVTYKANSTTAEVDYFKDPYYVACERDDVITFNSNGTYQFTDAGIVCSPSGNDNGTWVLSGTTSMQIDGDNVILESFDCKTLILVTLDTQVPGDKYKLTLIKQ